MSGPGRWLVAIAALIATAALLELILQLDPGLGAAAEGWIAVCGRDVRDTPLNHAPAGRAVQRLGTTVGYGQYAGREYEEDYDANGIKRSALRPQDGAGTRVLFMGDSFIQGYDDADTIPQHAYEWIAEHAALRAPLIVLNAGYSSYSPLIYTVQVKRLLPVLRPDFLVIDIDETDLFDDAVRYRSLAVRDHDGKVVAIGSNPELRAVAEICARARDVPVQLLRVSLAAYAHLRLDLHDWRARRNEQVFAVAQAPVDAVPAELRNQLAFFATTLDELFATVLAYLPADRVLVIRHPHRWHLPSRDGSPPWNRLVGEAVHASAARHGIEMFDAQDELAAEFADDPDRYYWQGDMHFNFDGMRAYGRLVGRELLRKLRAAGLVSG